ncbi:MAG: hypothetical protein K1X68_12925 [Saprospiraceae bacterium]|nr:hypothetical protein [Saprospiraceae bacterium]HMW40548.1 hypothetical protein [Saprospiraceae bacterium]HMX87766.1 hypothetical protein [Saprospiraceae bacterium]HMZ39342.1 hypothetical protein [Saprospiraceae bacterium]HNB30642.1 hypothetical protein [Saprospiraceae bacterium]
MKAKLFIIFSLVCFLFISKAGAQVQDYKSAIGLRFGYPLSISYKTFINDKAAIEGYAGFRSYSYYSWFNIGVLYQHHSKISSVEGLAWYIGGGANAFFWSYDDTFYPNASDYSSTSFGISGCIGLDYKFKNIPLNLSVDWIPTVSFGGEYLNGFGASYGGLSARYILK